MTTVEAVVFDLDGTLVDTMDIAPRLYVEVVRSLGGPQLTVEDVVEVWHIGPTATLLEHFLHRPVTPDELAGYFERCETVFADVRAFSGVIDMLAALTSAGFRIGVFTTATARAAAVMTSAAELDRYLSVVVGGDEVTLSKPAPDGLLVACERLDCPPSKAVYVGDAPVDLDCAAGAGALGIHAAWGGHPSAIGVLSAATPADVLELLRQ